MAKATREMKHNVDPAGAKPERETVKIAKGDKRQDDTTIRMIQDGHDVDCMEKLKKCNSRKDVYKENKSKACALTMSTCDRTMKHEAQGRRS